MTTMNNMKKLASLLLALVMVLAMAVPAMAEDEGTHYTITAPTTAPGNSHTYEVYQIFTGDYDEASGKLSNIVWGANGTGIEGTAVSENTLNELTGVNSSTDNTVKLAKIEKLVNFNSTSRGTITNGNSLPVAPGYYLIKDLGVASKDEEGNIIKDEEGNIIYTLPDGEAYSLYVVQVVGRVIISPKVGTVESDKKVQETNDSTSDADTWGEEADYDVGDDVPFQLTATLPENYDDYANGYKLTFHDTLSTGLTFNEDSVVVKIGDTTLNKGTDYQVVTSDPTDGCTFEIRFSNLKDVSEAQANSVITVEYTARLNEQAVVGGNGNTNKSNVTYTNDPNDDQAGENGKTPEDTVVVFTYNVTVNKVTEDGKNEDGTPEYVPLEGAGFTLYKWDAGTNAWAAVGAEITGETTFSFDKLDEGKYKLVETTVPAGYNKAADIEFTIESTLTDEKLTGLVVKDDTGAPVDDFTITVESGKIETNIVNVPGSTLPTTGGMGTTVIYTVGGLLVAAAVVMMISKKRSASK